MKIEISAILCLALVSAVMSQSSTDEPQNTTTDVCDSTNVDQKYGECLIPVLRYFTMDTFAVPTCISMYQGVSACLTGLNHHCGDSESARWQEYTFDGKIIINSGVYYCKNYDFIKTKKYCISSAQTDARKKCVNNANTEPDFCKKTVKRDMCHWKELAKCSKKVRDAVMKYYALMHHPSCKVPDYPPVHGGSGPMNKVGVLMVVAALVSILTRCL